MTTLTIEDGLYFYVDVKKGKYHHFHNDITLCYF